MCENGVIINSTVVLGGTTYDRENTVVLSSTVPVLSPYYLSC